MSPDWTSAEVFPAADDDSDTPMMEPWTEAGRRFVAWLKETYVLDGALAMSVAHVCGIENEAGRITGSWLSPIVAEVEARAYERARIRQALEALRPPDRFVSMDGKYEQGLTESAVLAIVDDTTASPVVPWAQAFMVLTYTHPEALAHNLIRANERVTQPWRP